MYRVWLAVSLLLASFAAHAQSTEIKVLGVYLPGVNVNDARDKLATLPATWSNTGISFTSIKRENFGVPVPAPAGTPTTLVETDVMNPFIKNSLAFRALRAQYAADVIILYRPNELRVPDGQGGYADRCGTPAFLLSFSR